MSVASCPTMKYQEASEKIWHPAKENSAVGVYHETLKELIRYATLAPSSHNTQCWKFIGDNADDSELGGISILPDFERRCPVVDPDNHHLYVTLGCAVENLCQSAMAFGLKPEVDASSPSTGIHVRFTPCKPNQSKLFDAIPQRQMSRCEYNGELLSNDELDQLDEAAAGNGVKVMFLTDRESIENALGHILLANVSQISDKNFVRELASWIRFGEQEAISKGDGIPSPTTGHSFGPSVLMRWIFPLVLRPGSENSNIVRQVSSSAGIAIFVSEEDDIIHWVECGRAYERFALQATAMGIRNAMMNQPVEDSTARAAFSKAFDINGRPDLVVRFGKGGPQMPHSLRRPIDDVLIEE